MKRVLLAAALAVALPAFAHAGASGLKVAAKISGPDGGWDYASFDPARRRVYVAHGDAVMMIDANTGKVTPEFAKGFHLHAVVPVPGTDLIVTTNSGDNTAKVIDAKTGALLGSVPGPKDSDSAAFDPSTGDVVVIGGDSGEVVLVDPKAMKAVGDIKVGGDLEFAAPDGKGLLYINGADTHEIVVVDLKAGKVVTRYPMPGCKFPTGLALVEGGRLVSSCGTGAAEILNAADGKVIASLPIGAGPDAVIYDARRGLALIPSRTGTLAVIALNGPHANTIIDTVTTEVGARTGAVDPKTGRVWLPSAQFGPPPAEGGRPKALPGTFHVLELDR